MSDQQHDEHRSLRARPYEHARGHDGASDAHGRGHDDMPGEHGHDDVGDAHGRGRDGVGDAHGRGHDDMPGAHGRGHDGVGDAHGHGHDGVGDRHGHGHDGVGDAHGHQHGVARDADRRWLSVALGLITAYMLGEVVVGVLARSLALVSDAAHMLTDAGAIVLALVAMRLAGRPPKGGYTFGLKRAEILSAQANGITMLILGAVLAVEAVRRLIAPPEVAGLAVFVTAVAGIGVNLAAVWALSRANRTSLNIQGAFQHILNDLFAFIATAAAGLVMVFTGFTRADAIATLLVVVLMFRAGLGLVRASGRIFLEAAPSGIDPPALGTRLAGVPDVVEVHDLHVWQITSGEPAMSAHVLVAEGRDCHAVRAAIEGLLRREYRITHSTLQVDHAGAELEASAGYEIGLEDAHCADSHGESYRPAPTK